MPERRIERVGFVVHAGRPAAVEAAGRLIEWLRVRTITSRSLTGEDGLAADETTPEATFGQGLDLVVSVGGDGTLLRAAHLASMADVPVLGVKVGRVGFLTEVEPDEAPDLLAAMLEGAWILDERGALEARPRGAPWTDPQWALNEVMVEKRARHRLITLAVWIGGEYVTTFSADGVMVATPTGSTAYSFSAKGPIVSPKVPCLLVTPVSPHMVFDRAIVVSLQEDVALEVLGDEPGFLSADGRPGFELPVGSSVRIGPSDRPARLVRRPTSPGFFTLLREKFALPGANPHTASGPAGPSPGGPARMA
jgi:NAD+ kinase